MSPGLLTSVLIWLFMVFKSVALRGGKKKKPERKNTAAFESFLRTSEKQPSVYSSCAQIHILISVFQKLV